MILDIQPGALNGLDDLSGWGGMSRQRAQAMRAAIQRARAARAAGMPLAGLDELQGWGKLKKKLGLNKLKTRQLVKKVAKVVPGASLLVPTKDNLKAGAQGLAIGGAVAATVLTGGKALAVIKPLVDAQQAKKAAEAAAASGGDIYQEYAQAPGLPSDYLNTNSVSVNSLAPGAMTGEYLPAGTKSAQELAEQGGLKETILRSMREKPLLWVGGAIITGGALIYIVRN